MARTLTPTYGVSVGLGTRHRHSRPTRSAAAQTSSQPPPLSVLFLGDRGHHVPADRAAQITPVFAGRGIRVTYTERVDDLNAETLAKHDALLIYANINEITPAQEKALIAYVEGGGAFVPVHCASYCFLNSPRYIALVGAQFLRHGTGEFETKVVDPSHPIMKGLEPFRTWDETYVHHKHNDGRPSGPPGPPGRADRGAVDLGADPGERAASSTRPTAMTAGPGRTRVSTTCSSGASAGR